MTYSEIEKLPPEAYLKPELFATLFDTLAIKSKQYEKGLEISKNSTRISLSVRGIWSAITKDGGHVSSYEGIGYHAGTADLLRGFLAGTAEVIVFRLDYPPTVIKQAS